MEGCNSILCNDAEAVINIPFLHFRCNRWRIDSRFLDLFNAEIGHNGTDRTAHGTTVDLFVDFVIEDKIVVR